MRKIVFISLVIQLLLITQTLADNPCSEFDPRCVENKSKPFQGVFFGFNVGNGVGVHKKTHSSGIISQKLSFGTKGIDGGINIGYNYKFGNIGIGIEGVFNLTNVSGYKSSNINNVAYLVEKAKLNSNAQVRGNIFYVLNDFIAPKLILGWETSIWKRTFSHAGIQTHKKHRHNSLLVGIGVDFKVCKHVIAGIEYTASFYRTNKLSIDGSDFTTFKPHYRKVALTFKFIY